MVDEQRNDGPGGDRGDGPRPRRFGGGGGGGGRSFPRRKVCMFCVDGIKHVDYKDVPRLRRFVSDRGMIEPRRKTGVCAKHQRSLAVAIKRARHLALLSFTEGAREQRDRGRDRDRRGGPGGGRFGREDRFSSDRGPGGGGDRFSSDRGDRGPGGGGGGFNRDDRFSREPREDRFNRDAPQGGPGGGGGFARPAAPSAPRTEE